MKVLKSKEKDFGEFLGWVWVKFKNRVGLGNFYLRSFRGHWSFVRSNNRIYESVITNRVEFFIRIYGFYDI